MNVNCADLSSVEGVSGVYVLKLSDTVVYIGASVNIAKRAKQHKKKFAFDNVDVYECSDFTEMRKLEEALIKEKHPQENVVHNREITVRKRCYISLKEEDHARIVKAARERGYIVGAGSASQLSEFVLDCVADFQYNEFLKKLEKESSHAATN